MSLHLKRIAADKSALLQLRERMKSFRSPADLVSPAGCLPTGILALDNALGGGIAQGKITEFVGKGSNGRTALAVALTARVSNGSCFDETRNQNCFVAWVDAGNCLDVASLERAGVKMSHVLWLRGAGTQPTKQALKSVDILMDSQSFSLMVLDFVEPGFRKMAQRSSWWMRIARKLQTSRAALLVLTREPSVFQPACRVVFQPGELLNKPLSFSVMHRGCGEVHSLSPLRLRRPCG